MDDGSPLFINGDTMMLIISIVAVLVSLLGLYYGARAGNLLRKITENFEKSKDILNDLSKISFEIKDKIVGRSQFTAVSVRINSDTDLAKEVWHITDTFSMDKRYYRFFENKNFAKQIERIKYFAPLELNKPILVGAVIRKHIAPRIEIINIDEEKRKDLINFFPFKAVVGDNMLLIGNQKILTNRGCEFGQFMHNDPNPFAKFLRRKYNDLDLVNGVTFEKWIAKQFTSIENLNWKELKHKMFDDQTIEEYMKDYNKDGVVGEETIDSALKTLHKRLSKN